METVLLLNKPLGVTPLELIQQYKADHPEYSDVKMGYAGRLDPMAEGLVLIMAGEENKNREKYLGLDKEYEIEILLGVATDTYDVLGLVTDSKEYKLPHKEDIEKVLPNFVGKITQTYPPYSSKTVDGKPLYYWAREGKLSDITIPTAQRTVYSIDYLGDRLIDKNDLIAEIFLKLATVQSGDFRKDVIIKAWEAFPDQTEQNPFTIMTLRVNCSSGTYMRSLAHEIGRQLGLPALAFSIKRTRVGDYSLT